MDPATPLVYARAARDAFAGPGQHFIEVPNAPHSFASPTTHGYSCQLAMLYGWIRDPQSEPFNCIRDIVPQDFVGTSDLAAYFGTTDVWENTSGVARTMPRRLDGLRRAMQRADIALPYEL